MNRDEGDGSGHVVKVLLDVFGIHRGASGVGTLGGSKENVGGSEVDLKGVAHRWVSDC